MQSIVVYRKSNLYEFLLIVSFVFTVLSQIEFMQTVTRAAMYACWLFVVALIIISNKSLVSGFVKHFVIFYSVFVFYCFALSFYNQDFLSNYYLKSLFIPLLVVFVGDYFGRTRVLNIERIARIYLLCSLALAIFVQLHYFPSLNNWFKSYIYVFDSKNSASQIWMSSIILGYFFCFKSKNTFRKVTFIVISTYIIFVSMLSQCRTSILGIAVCFLVYVFFASKHKIRLLIVILLTIVILSRFQFIQSFFNHFALIDKFKEFDANSLSSNRLDLYRVALAAFEESPILGKGKYYVDCSYIMILAESGIIGFLLIESIWLKRVIKTFKRGFKTTLSSALVVMVVFYLVESLFEGIPPFGPGACSFMLWFLTSYEDALNKTKAVNYGALKFRGEFYL